MEYNGTVYSKCERGLIHSWQEEARGKTEKRPRRDQ
jgi:hypothetical protein